MSKSIYEKLEAIDSRKSKDLNFIFGIDILDGSVEKIRLHTISSYKQIIAVCLIDLAYVIAYSGVSGTEHYVFDASPSGTGKDSAANQSYDLILQPVMEIQSKRKEAYNYERQSSDEKLPSKSFHCTHTSDATPQGTYLGFETTKAQYPRLGEIGNKMRNKENPLINFITESYGRHTLIQPNYKKDLDSGGELTIDGISLFFYGNSNIQMMGHNTFMHHLKGGLLNRCVLIYNKHTRPFEERPESYDIPNLFVDEINNSVRKLIDFGKKHSTMTKPKIPRTRIYMYFDRYIYDKTNEIKATGVQDIFKRTMQNLNAIILTLHYLKCWEQDSWLPEIQDETVHTAVRYMEYVIDGYDVLIDELVGVAQDKANEANSEKIHKRIKELSVNERKIIHRDIYRPLHFSRKDYDALINGMNYHTDKKYLYALPLVTK